MSNIAALVAGNLDIWTSATQRKSGAGRGGGGKRISLYGIEQLRALILDLAVRGKLVPQDSGDEPASELLKRIKTERARLIKAKAIGKGKSFPTVSEEPPFAIPANWVWTQISEIGHDWGQTEPTADFTYIDVGSINQSLGIVHSPNVVSASDAPSRARKVVRKGTVIYSTVRPYLLNIAIVDQDFDPEPIASTAFAIVHPFSGIEAGFVYRYLRSQSFVSYVESCQTGIAYPAINDRQFFAAWCPLPPLAEQGRIVAKVDELMALCDALERESADAMAAHQALVEELLAMLVNSADATDLAANWARLETHFDTLFTTDASIEALKQTILDLAVDGVLAERVGSIDDSKAAVALAKKTKLILIEQEGLRARTPIVRSKLNRAESAFPSHWTFTDFDSVFVTVSGVTKGQKVATNEAVEVPYLRVANVQRGHLDLDEVKNITVKQSDFRRYQLRNGDVMMTEGGDWDKLGRATIWRGEIPDCIHQNHVFRVRFEQAAILPEWVVLFVNSPLGREFFSRAAKQTTNLASINMTQLRSCPIPIPPLAEQRRIVAKVDALMALCDQLKTRLADAAQTQRHLADAITERAAA